MVKQIVKCLTVVIRLKNFNKRRLHRLIDKRGNVRITYSECEFVACYPACSAQAPYYIVICGLPGCTIFYQSVSQTAGPS